MYVTVPVIRTIIILSGQEEGGEDRMVGGGGGDVWRLYFHEPSWHNIYSEFIHNFKNNCIQLNHIFAVVITNVY